MYKKAVRQKIRFQTTKGAVTVEDLWDMSLEQLNAIAKSLNKKLKEASEEDFLGESRSEDTLTKLQFDIVIDIITDKKAEQKERAEASAKKAERNRIMELIERKKDANLEALPVEELQKMLDNT